MYDSVRPYRWQPIRLPRPSDSPGKNTGVGCYFLLHCIKVKSESEVARSCPTLNDPMDYSLPGSSIHGFSMQEYWSGVPLPFLVLVTQLCSNSLRPQGLQPARLLCPWDSPGKNTGEGCHSLLQGIFPTQGSNPHLLPWQAGRLPLNLLGSPRGGE